MNRISAQDQLRSLHRELDACTSCSKMIGPVVHGPAIMSKLFLLGQAPGPHEGKFMRPFAWTAGKTLFKWFENSLGVDEQTFRANVYMAAVARCFPGKANGGGDRKPDPTEIDSCQRFLQREVQILKPKLILPVGTLAIEQVLEQKVPLAEVVGEQMQVSYHGVKMDCICLPHPSGASTWHRTEPGVTLLQKALGLVRAHPEVQRVLSASQRVTRSS